MNELSSVIATYPEANLAKRALEHLCQSGINPNSLSIAVLDKDALVVRRGMKVSAQPQGATFLVIVQASDEDVSFAKDLLQGTHETFHTVHGERVMEHRS